MERLRLLQKPFEPASTEAGILELLERAAVVDAGIVAELGTFDEREDDGVLESSQDRPDAVQRERIADSQIGLHLEAGGA